MDDLQQPEPEEPEENEWGEVALVLAREFATLNGLDFAADYEEELRGGPDDRGEAFQAFFDGHNAAELIIVEGEGVIAQVSTGNMAGGSVNYSVTFAPRRDLQRTVSWRLAYGDLIDWDSGFRDEDRAAWEAAWDGLGPRELLTAPREIVKPAFIRNDLGLTVPAARGAVQAIRVAHCHTTYMHIPTAPPNTRCLQYTIPIYRRAVAEYRMKEAPGRLTAWYLGRSISAVQYLLVESGDAPPGLIAELKPGAEDLSDLDLTREAG